MELNHDPNWIKEKAAKEDGCFVSAGADEPTGDHPDTRGMTREPGDIDEFEFVPPPPKVLRSLRCQEVEADGQTKNERELDRLRSRCAELEQKLSYSEEVIEDVSDAVDYSRSVGEITGESLVDYVNDRIQHLKLRISSLESSLATEREQNKGFEEALTKTLGELQAVQTAAALGGLPAQAWAGFGGSAKRALDLARRSA